MSDQGLESDRVQFALTEYEACNDTRDHYDNLRWTIGSIFIAASLTLFGLSFSNLFGDKSSTLVAVALMFLFSIVMMIIWYLYSQHVNPYVLTAVIRAHEIESSFSFYGLRLNKKVWENSKIGQLHVSGVCITYGLVASTVTFWMLRVGLAVYVYFGSLTSDCILWFFILLIVWAIALILFLILHLKLNPIDINEEIKSIWKKQQPVKSSEC